jgi:hypothetical protein
MKITQKQINKNVVVKRAYGFTAFYSFYFECEKYSFKKDWNHDFCGVSHKEIDFIVDSFPARTKKEFVRNIAIYLNQ